MSGKPADSIKSHHLFMLDGLRGIAALYVALMHVTESLPLAHYEKYLANSHMAVDLFFMLSGYVLSLAYGPSLQTGRLTVANFFVKRLIRLMPLVVLGVLLATLALTAKYHAHGKDEQIGALWETAILNALMLPSPLLTAQNADNAYPTNGPTWSLSAEMIGSMLFACCLLRAPIKALIGLILICALLVLWVAHHWGTLHHGWEWHLLWIGYLRMLFALSIGVLMYRTQACWAPRLGRYAALSVACPFAVAAAFMFPVGAAWQGVYEWACVALLFPVVIALAVMCSPSWRGKKFMVWLGELSFPFYALHFPVFRLMQPIRALLASAGLGGSVLILQPMVAAVVAWMVYKWIDMPVRAWLSALHRQGRA